MEHCSIGAVSWLRESFEEGVGEINTDVIAQACPEHLSKCTITRLVKKIFPKVIVCKKRDGPNAFIFVYRGLCYRQPETKVKSLSLQDVLTLALSNQLVVFEFTQMNITVGYNQVICGRQIVKKLEIEENGNITIFVNEKHVKLETLSLHSKTDMDSAGLLLVFNIIKKIKVCQGYLFDGKVNDAEKVLREEWTDNGTKRAAHRSVNCEWALPFHTSAMTCRTCKRQEIYLQTRRTEEVENGEKSTLQLRPSDDESIEQIFNQVLPSLKEMPEFKLLLRSQIDNLGKMDKRQRRWHPKAYEDLRESGFLVLPSGNCVQQGPGINPKVLQWMLSEFGKTGQPDTGREGGIVFDEMSIQADLQFSSRNGETCLVGFVELGEEAENMKIIQNGKPERALATHVLQMVFLGNEGFRFPICHFPTAECDSAVLWRKFWAAVEALHDWSFKTNYVCMDGAAQNRAFMRAHFNTSPADEVFTTRNLFSGESHTLKKIRNNLLKSSDQSGTKRRLIVGGKSIFWSHWVKAWEWDRATHSMSIYHKLTRNHMFPDTGLKMRNKLAFEVLNKDMLYLMKTYQHSLSDSEGQNLNSTIEFLEQTSVLVEIFTDLRPITSIDDQRLFQLNTVLTWFNKWEEEVLSGEHDELSKTEYKKKLMSDQTREDLSSSIIGLIQLTKIKEGDKRGGYIVPGRVNSDIVENIFCQQRGLHNGAMTNPNYFTYCHTMNSILLGQSTVSRKNNVGHGSEPFNFHSGEPLRKSRKVNIT